MTPTRRRVILASIVIAAIGLSGQSTAIGNAEPEPPPTPTITTVPESPAPEGVTPFVDNPAIVDSHPQSIDSWSRLPESNALTVQFTSGTPECFGVHAEVQETADIVAVKLRSGTQPEAVGRACTMIAVFATLPITLESPVGNRAVVSIT
jgi:hypothetical protein